MRPLLPSRGFLHQQIGIDDRLKWDRFVSVCINTAVGALGHETDSVSNAFVFGPFEQLAGVFRNTFSFGTANVFGLVLSEEFVREILRAIDRNRLPSCLNCLIPCPALTAQYFTTSMAKLFNSTGIRI